MTTCPTCGQKGGDRVRPMYDLVDAGHPYGRTAIRCDDPFHDLADRVVEALAAKDAEIATLSGKARALSIEVLELRAENARLREAQVLPPWLHRAVGSTEHDPSVSAYHGMCRICATPWPCDAQGEADRAALAPRAPIDETRAEGADRDQA